jgi:pimeloyl-ACP methyl ester carboxylesterase
VILLHGWPYDIHSYAEAAPALASGGYRVIVPYLRGYGSTRFLSAETIRNGQQAALALDVIALMDALGIESAVLAGFDWGARSANVVAALWPARCKAMVSVSGYLIGSQAANAAPLVPAAELSWWYQFYFATERGRAGYDKFRREFAELIWHTASPKWAFDDATFARSAPSFDNADHADIVIHNYRWRLGVAAGEPRYDDAEQQLAAGPSHYGSHDHPRRRRQRRAPPRPQRLRDKVRRQVRAPDHLRGRRAQPAPGGARPVRQSHH